MGACLEQFLDLILDQQLLGKQVPVLLAVDGSDSHCSVNLMHLP